MPRPGVWSAPETSLRERVAALGGEAMALAAEFLDLAGREAQDRVRELGPLLLLLTAAGASALVFLLAAAVAAIFALSALLPLWSAAGLVAAAALVLGLACAGLVRRRVRRLMRAPEQTLGALQEVKGWLRAQART